MLFAWVCVSSGWQGVGVHSSTRTHGPLPAVARVLLRALRARVCDVCVCDVWHAACSCVFGVQGDKDLSKLAIRIHKAMLGYAGDRSMSFPATLAQDILQKGLETPDIVDEIYLQVCKHLTENPRPESAHRGWQVRACGCVHVCGCACVRVYVCVVWCVCRVCPSHATQLRH